MSTTSCSGRATTRSTPGIGVAAFTFIAVMLLAGSSDVIAVTFGLSVNAVIWTLRTALLVVPPIAGLVAGRLCVELRDRDPRPTAAGDRSSAVDGPRPRRGCPRAVIRAVRAAVGAGDGDRARATTGPPGAGRRAASVSTAVRTRREPPPLRRVAVRRVEARTPRLQRVTLSGEGLAGFEPGLPGGSVRLLLPPSSRSTVAIASSELVLPTWNGNEYRYDDGTRPPIRTLTPLRFSPDDGELDIEVVLHGSGPLSAWAASARPGAPAAVSGPGRGYEVDADCRSLRAGRRRERAPGAGPARRGHAAEADVRVIVEIADGSARRLGSLTVRGLTVTWHEQAGGAAPGDALADAVIGGPARRRRPDLGGRRGGGDAAHSPPPLRDGRGSRAVGRSCGATGSTAGPAATTSTDRRPVFRSWPISPHVVRRDRP